MSVVSVLPWRSVTPRGRLDRGAGEEQKEKEESRHACHSEVQGRTAALPGGLDSLMRIPGSPLIVLSGGLTLVTSPGPALPAPLVQSFPRLLRVVKLSCLL